MTSLGIAYESEVLRVHGQRRRAGVHRRSHDHRGHGCRQRRRGRQLGDKNIPVSALIFQAEKMLQNVQAQGRVVYIMGVNSADPAVAFTESADGRKVKYRVTPKTGRSSPNAII